MILRWAAVGLALLVFGACGPCGGSTSVSSSSSSTGNQCGHPGLCLTFTGPLAGETSGLIQNPDCIPGGGLDVIFTTHIKALETSIEILVTDSSAKTFNAGSFAIKPRRTATAGAAYASIFVKPDTDVPGFPGGWSTDATGSSGIVVVNADQSGKVQSGVIAPANVPGAALHVSGTFNCR